MNEIAADAITPDEKDWTWTLRETCPQCGFTAAAVAPGQVADLIRQATAPWRQVLQRSTVRERPAPTTWSPVEYACHVRDVCDLFAARTRLMLTEDQPRFANWDGDVAAVEGAYAAADPQAVATELVEAGTSYAAVHDDIGDTQRARTGLRGDGKAFSVVTLGQYGLHELVHHLWDVGVRLPDAN